VETPLSEATQTRKDFLSVLDLDAFDLERCLRLAAQLKADRSLGRHAPTADALDGRHIAMLFAQDAHDLRDCDPRTWRSSRRSAA
jgi:ornithine carbamoyltransferase